MAKRDGWWPCGVAGGHVGWLVAMWDGWWPCGMAGGHVGWLVAMWDGWWPCGMAGGHVGWLVAKRDGWWPCGMAGGQAGWLVAMWDGWWPSGMAGGHVGWLVAMWDGWWLCGMAGGQAGWLVAKRDGWWPCGMAGGHVGWLVVEWLKHSTANGRVACSDPTSHRRDFLPLLGVFTLKNKVGVYFQAFSPEIIHTEIIHTASFGGDVKPSVPGDFAHMGSAFSRLLATIVVTPQGYIVTKLHQFALCLWLRDGVKCPQNSILGCYSGFLGNLARVSTETDSPEIDCHHVKLLFTPYCGSTRGWDKVCAHVVQLTFHRYSAQ